MSLSSIQGAKSYFLRHNPDAVRKETMELLEKTGLQTTLVDAKNAQATLDANKDGKLTKTELKTGLEGLQTSINNKTTLEDYKQNNDTMMRALMFGRQLLDNFDAIAKLDGTGDSVTQNDLSSLASRYGSDQNITYGDIRSLTQDVIA